jgi:hypothetical protein
LSYSCHYRICSEFRLVRLIESRGYQGNFVIA